ncbi:class F sortase [Streptomyces purpureus]|uniref:class F sortase n=1 Tax=Streptomyces purpureus TaxID=1951 RepID=UPI000382B7EA|nr:class F sortase [Streptomyces purpureus]
MPTGERPAGTGRLLTGVAWAVLLLGLWLWAREATGGSGRSSAPTTGDVAAVGRPLGVALPPAHEPMGHAAPRRVEIPSIGVTARLVPRGLDPTGAVEPPPYAAADAVGWFDGGAEPGVLGAALLVGHVDTESKPAVFYGLSAVRPGQKVRVTRSDGSVAEFTVDDVQVFTRERFDARKVYGQRSPDRAELRLITCGGTFDRATGSYTANVVVSAYLTGASKPRAAAAAPPYAPTS